MPVTIYYHADCLDGFGAAYAAWRRFGDAAKYRPLHHGEAPIPADLAGHDVFVLDFSFPESELRAMSRLANSVCQIDHHASASDAWGAQLEARSDGMSCYQNDQEKLTVIFNLSKSGVRLAWEHFHPQLPVPQVLRHIEDQDLWRFSLPGTRAFCRSIRLQPFDFTVWDNLIRSTERMDAPAYLDALHKGEAIEAFVQHEVARLARGRATMPARLRGNPVDALQARRHGQATVSDGASSWLAIPGIAVNANALFASELGHHLAEQSGTFGLVWQLTGHGEVNVSLRSTDHFDVGQIASRYGGGGHRNAAGFRISLPEFAAEIIAKPAALLND